MGATNLWLPRFVRAAAYVDTTLHVSIPIVVGFSGATPEGVDVSIDWRI